MALAHFVFHSAEGVKALLLAAVGSVVSLVPSIQTRVEYKFTETGLAKRPSQAKKPRAFKDVFTWDELSHFIPTQSGFKFYKQIQASNPLARFLKLHFSGDHSGELHVEREDRDKVQAIIDQHDIATSKPPTPGRIGPDQRK
jgi:hypothetical protein